MVFPPPTLKTEPAANCHWVTMPEEVTVICGSRVLSVTLAKNPRRSPVPEAMETVTFTAPPPGTSASVTVAGTESPAIGVLN
jgi:hypothetical protein